jgi:hypothetical protein
MGFDSGMGSPHPPLAQPLGPVGTGAAGTAIATLDASRVGLRTYGVTT